ncbi:MAG TPA: hypothetical protein VEG08_11375, partial [Terriglobales bacterium]|nr:hypothetical protein [Terriglobales bacterium]
MITSFVAAARRKRAGRLPPLIRRHPALMPDAPAPPPIPAESLPSVEVDSTVSQVQVVMRRLVHGSAL